MNAINYKNSSIWIRPIAVVLAILTIVFNSSINAQYGTINIVKIDSNCVDSFISIINQKSNENWNDSLDSNRNYPAMNLFRNISLGINNFLVLQDVNSYTGNPYLYIVYYFGLVTDYNADISTSVGSKDRIPIAHSDFLRSGDISSFTINEFYDDNQLIQTLSKELKINHYFQFTDKKACVPRKNNLQEINKIRKVEFNKFRFTEIQFENHKQIVKYYKWERMIQGCARTVAIEIRISNLMD